MNNILERGYRCFLEDKQIEWNYDFEIGKEFTTSDYEQSFLSQMLLMNFAIQTFTGIQKHHLNEDGRSIFLQYNNEGLNFLFDVMHNPKADLFSQKIKDDCSEKWQDWRNHYHTIGNFSIVPRTIKARKGPRLQFVHKHLGERWDLLLKYMAQKWDEWGETVDAFSFSKFTFKDYMKISGQQLYFKCIYDDFDFTDMGNKKWSKIVAEWNSRVDDKCFDESLICFDDFRSSQKQASIINNLIEARGRCVLAVLKDA